MTDEFFTELVDRLEVLADEESEEEAADYLRAQPKEVVDGLRKWATKNNVDYVLDFVNSAIETKKCEVFG